MDGRHMPYLDMTQFIASWIYVPNGAQIPSGPLAEHLHYFGGSLFQRWRLCQDAAHRILNLQTPLGPPTLGDD